MHLINLCPAVTGPDVLVRLLLRGTMESVDWELLMDLR